MQSLHQRNEAKKNGLPQPKEPVPELFENTQTASGTGTLVETVKRRRKKNMPNWLWKFLVFLLIASTFTACALYLKKGTLENGYITPGAQPFPGEQTGGSP